MTSSVLCVHTSLVRDAARLIRPPNRRSPARRSPAGRVRRRTDATALLADIRGLSTVEYIVILVLIAVIAIVAWKQFGESVEYHVRDSTTQINHLGD